ncbi:hypothetical protein FLA_2990 [Filimonas lacunae]|nr:hypothetical protein FLA_2990 [Filimonas lacunae]
MAVGDNVFNKFIVAFANIFQKTNEDIFTGCDACCYFYL